MDKSISLSIRGLLTTGLVLLALAVAYLVGADRGEAADETTPAAKPNHTLTMVGVGTASAVPDKVAFDVSVGVNRDDLDLALDDTSKLMETVLATLDEQGVDKADVRTTGLAMSPVYRYTKNTRTFNGYRVNQQIAVVADLDGAGDIVPAIIAAAGNAARVGDLRLQVGDAESVLADARDAAFEQARAKAEEYAAKTGQELGDVLTLTEVSSSRNDDYDQRSAYAAAADMADEVAIPISAGESDLLARVQVVWQLT